MTKKVVVELTQCEAEALSLVATNGWGDGDFAEWISDRTQSRACIRAMHKLDAAIRVAPQTQVSSKRVS